jgi:predicted secreted Zn-dependent protease
MRSGLALLALLVSASVVQAEEPDFKASIKTETYAISGETGAALYASIGEKGPVIGGGKIRAIAYTDFRLTWQRRYENPGGACVLAAARPKLTIIYRLPKPVATLTPAVKANWQVFADGIIRHERHHGEIIVAMVKRIEAETIGIRFDNDPDCRQVRAELNRRLGRISRDERQQNIQFDRIEMGNGGNVQQLVLALVNGP